MAMEVIPVSTSLPQCLLEVELIMQLKYHGCLDPYHFLFRVTIFSTNLTIPVFLPCYRAHRDGPVLSVVTGIPVTLSWSEIVCSMT